MTNTNERGFAACAAGDPGYKSDNRLFLEAFFVAHSMLPVLQKNGEQALGGSRGGLTIKIHALA